VAKEAAPKRIVYNKWVFGWRHTLKGLFKLESLSLDMRIGIDTRLVYYRREGGIAQYTLRLLNALLRLGSGDEFVALHQRNDRLANLVGPAAGAGRVRGRRLLTPPHHRYEQWTLPLELAPAMLDVLHSTDFIPPFRRRYASVITVHDLAFKLYPELLTAESAAYYGQLERAVYSAEQIIAVSEATRLDILRLLPVDERKITVIHEAADLVYRPLADAGAIAQVLRTYRLASPFILCVGTIEPRKNLTMLLQAFRRLLDHGACEVQLVIAGREGWLAAEFYALRERLGLNERVRLLGPLPAGELAALYNAATAFVMPSLYEGFGLPLVEAMSCGAPVLVSNVSSLPEIAGSAGLRLDPSDPLAWADALARLLADGALRQSMRRQSLLRAQAFSWSRAARQTLDVYYKASQLARFSR
jgi:glycosyltransferase involved in cell wall biosynthesis